LLVDPDIAEQIRIEMVQAAARSPSPQTERDQSVRRDDQSAPGEMARLLVLCHRRKLRGRAPECYGEDRTIGARMGLE